MRNAKNLLTAHDLGVGVGDRLLVEGLTLELRAGEILAVLGRNGAGKTLTLQTLAGLRQPAAGSVRIGTRAVGELSRRALARHVGVLFQDLDMGLSTSALDAVLVGRYPHLAPWQWEAEPDRRAARAALERVELAGFAGRETASLSGGEQRRLAIATLLAQDPQVLLLDEPTNHLDPHHQLTVLRLLQTLAKEGRAILATMHDPSLADRYADRALLLYGDGRWRAGPVAELLSAENLSELYLTPLAAEVVRGHRVFVAP